MRALIPVFLLASAVSACTYEDGHGPHHKGPSNSSPPPSTNVESATIDTGASMAEMEPGRGVGAFVEYSAGGSWSVYTTCDTEISKLSCEWDIIVSADTAAEIYDFLPDRLESSDYLEWEDERSVRMVTTTSTDFDGFFVETAPGATLRVDVFLDGQPAPRYIYWVGDGGLHKGSPTNPIDLFPSAP